MQYGRRNTRIVKVRLYSDIAKADADSSEVFKEYESSASQVKVVKIMENNFQDHPDAQDKQQSQYRRMHVAAHNY